ncbi:MAG: glycosyltransferase, partial [Planctomycetes bacterium]|nr:glycosyltransferase [Planctomycetota bacterium]
VPMKKITIIMNVPSAKIFNTKTRKIKPRILDSQSVFTLAYHGLLSDIYDLSGTIKAIKELKSKVPGIKFLVIGSGPKENDYKKMVKELQLEKEVVFTGRIPQENIPAALSEVNLGVVPLKNAALTQLAFPTKLVEYVALGIPVLTADRKTIKKYFDDTALCFYDPADEKSLAECLAGLARDPEKRNNLVKNASKCYDAILWDKMKERYYGLIEAVSYK